MTEAGIAPVETDVADAAALGFRLGFFKLVVRDLPAMVRFYTETFGFQERDRVALPGLEEVMLALPGDRFTLVLYHHTDGRAVTIGNGHGPVGFTTADLDGAMARAFAHGATPMSGPFDLRSLRLAFIHDPEGHEIELIQPPAPVASKE